jgi:diguanylate cyclase (GGDEF)-like protein
LPSLDARTRRQAERLEALWRIANTPHLGGDELLLAMLREAAVAMRPGYAYAGSLGHIEGSDYVLDAIEGHIASEGEAMRRQLRVGERIPRAELIHVRDLAAGRTQAWDDCQLLPDLSERARISGLRSQITTQFTVRGTIHVLTLASRQTPSSAPFGPEDFAYIELLASFFARQLEVDQLQATLAEAELHTRHHAERLESLWRIVNSPNLHGELLLLAMLREAAVAIRPAQTYVGTLGHLEGSIYVLDASVGHFSDESDGARRLLPIGSRVERSELLRVRDLNAGRTQAWDDCLQLPDLPPKAREAGLRSQITTQFAAGETTYVLSLGSRDVTSGNPFGPEDIAYIELLGSFFARQLELEALQELVGEAELRARHHAERLEGLWQIANNPTLRGEALTLAMLQQAAASIRPSLRFRGLLGRIEADEVVVIGVGVSADDTDPFARELKVGRRSRLENTIIPQVGHTKAWEDLATHSNIPPALTKLAWRAVISTQFEAAGARYSLSFASPEPADTPFSPADLAYMDVLASSFAKQLELNQLEDSLRDEEGRSRQHAERLESLWQIANNPTLRGEAVMFAMLRQAAAAIQPSLHFRGVLGRIEGNEVVTVGVTLDPGDNEPQTNILTVGRRSPLQNTIIPLVNGNRAWADLAADANLPVTLAAAGWRAVISTHFAAAGSRYSLTFASSEPASEPFSAADLAYVDVLASSFAQQLEVNHLEETLRAEEERSRQHAERLEALWQTANDPALHGDELVHTMLLEGAAAIRRPPRFRGLLGRLEGTEVVIIGAGVEPHDDDPRAKRLTVGRRSPFFRTIDPNVGRTQGWEDLAGLSEFPGRLAAAGWRSAISTQFEAGGTKYTLTFTSDEPLTTPFTAEDSAYLDVLAAAIAKQLEVDQLQQSLRVEEERSRHHAERLAALWTLVNDPSLRDDDLLQSMLAQATAALRPDQEFRGMLWRVQGSDMVVEGLAQSQSQLEKLHTHVGAVVPLERTIVGQAVAEGTGIRSWDDMATTGEASAFSVAHATRSLLVTTFTAGATTWGLSFASERAATHPLGPQDRVYLDVLASFFANHVQQRWQFERIQYQQSHDVLTGLLNRSQFRSAVRSAARTSSRYALILVDVDAFREINESYGHMIGDALLVEVGNALRLRAAEDEFVGRIGDDVFCVYIGNPDSKEFVLSRALSFAEAFRGGFSTGDRDGKEFIARTAGLGVAVAPDDGTSIDAILSHADAALVRAKGRGHGSLVFYEAGMEGDAHRRTALRNELTEAVAQDQFELYYQPHVEINTGKVTGCEALIRWNHPVRGLLLPQHFIPFAEETGIITDIDSWVMQNAFASANQLAALRPGFRLYFNLSGRQAGDPSVIRSLIAAARKGIVLANLGVEITETDAMRDVEATRVVCRALRRLNVRIAIDDFGTGYSSLSSLKRLPVDIVKIDRSFVSGVLTDPHDETIADTIISIAARFGFESLAEGVEDLAEIGWLRQRPCRYMQGYVICHPLPLAEFKAWLAAHDG